MDENIVEEKSESSKSLEGLIIFLHIVSLMMLIIGVYMLLTNSGASSSSISSGMQTLTDALPYIEFGMIVIMSLISLVVAFIVRKDAPILALFLLIIGIVMPIVFWYFTIGMPQPQIIPVSH